MRSAPAMRRILGVDPGLNHTGWGVVEYENNHLRYIASGTLSPPAKKGGHAAPLAERLLLLQEGLSRIITAHAPTEAALEEVFVNRNPRSSLLLGHARGALLVTLAAGGLVPQEFAPNLVKKTVAGVGRADKGQIQHMLKLLLPQASPDSADAADALAVAITAAHLGL